jgi:hypothetical protein
MLDVVSASRLKRQRREGEEVILVRATPREPGFILIQSGDIYKSWIGKSVNRKNSCKVYGVSWTKTSLALGRYQ